MICSIFVYFTTTKISYMRTESEERIRDIKQEGVSQSSNSTMAFTGNVITALWRQSEI